MRFSRGARGAVPFCVSVGVVPVRVSIVSASVCAALAGIAAPAARGAAEISLSMADAVARAENTSPLVRRARAERVMAESQRVGAAVLFPSNPVASAVWGERRDASTSVPKAQGSEWDVRLEQTFEIAGQRAPA